MAGVCGFIAAQRYVSRHRQFWLLVVSVFIANMPDLDVFPGLLQGDPRSFHHQGMHSLTAAVAFGLLVAFFAGRLQLSRIRWGVWGGGLYLSHVLLDLLVDDPVPPFGAQLLWPFSEAYFISPVTPFARFDYFDPALGMMRTMFTLHNLTTMLQEILLITPFVGLSWYIGKYHNEQRIQR